MRVSLRTLSTTFHILTPTCVASAFGGLIAFGIQNANVDIATWRLLFIVEGIPPILLGLLAMWFLPDRPEETPFLTEAERKLQLERMNRGIRADVGRTVNKAHIAAAFKDWRVSRPALSISCTPLSVYFTDLYGRCNLLRRKLCTRIYLCVLAHYNQDLRLQ